MTDIAEQPLPRTFEEFNEQRRASFIRVKDYKQAGNRLVGYLCSYTPLEIIDAAGAAGVALCGTSDEVIPEAEKVLPANLCPLACHWGRVPLACLCPLACHWGRVPLACLCPLAKRRRTCLA